jgi:HEPN domain-containing protein
MKGPGVDRDGFESRMREIDAKLGKSNVPALWRPIFAWSQMTGRRIFRSEPPDLNCGPFEGPNLYHEIEGWYGRHYPVQATLQCDWGVRWFHIGGEFYRARMPIIFNSTTRLNAFEYLEDLPRERVTLLSEAEVQYTQFAFNGFFRQASEINLSLSSGCADGDVYKLLERSWSDLRASGSAFVVADPTAILFPIQQAAEKSLKALLIARGVVANAKAATKFKHDIGKLMEMSAPIAQELEFLQEHAQLLSYDQSIRYQRTRMETVAVLNRMDYAYAICAAVAKSLLRARPRRNAA